MNLSEYERRKLERLRRYYRQETFERALRGRGIGLILFVTLIISCFMSDRYILLGWVFLCIPVGILSSYYGPFKIKIEEEAKD